MSISYCYSKIRNYNNIKPNLQQIISLLQNSSNDINDIKFDIKNKYIINDEETPISNRINNLDEDIKKTSNYLKNTIIPGIDSAITGLYNRIERLEYEEEQRKIKEEKERLEREKNKEQNNGNNLY